MNIEELYSVYDTLTNAGEKISEHSKEYAAAINAARLGAAERQLAIQMITKFFSFFPAQQNAALEAICELLEAEDRHIRIAAMKALPAFCKDSLLYIRKIAEWLGQMLHVEDTSEHTCATNIFFEILKKDPATVIQSVFKVIHDPVADNLLRFKCLQFILTKIKALDSSLVTTEIQDLMITNVKATLSECIADEFVLLMNYLVTTSLVKSFVGQKEITDIVMQQIRIDKDFKPYQTRCNFTNRLVSCVKYILPFYSAKVESTEMVKYYCDKVFAQWELIGELNNGVQYQTAIAQQLATMAPFCGSLDNPTKQVEEIFDVLKLYMPEPPEDTTCNDMPHFNFSIVESLLFAFHALARQCPDFLSENQARLKDFRARLLYFSRGVQGCKQVLDLAVTEKVFSADEKRIREMCPLLLKNINQLVKDLFYQPPVYKCKITLSFTKKEEATKAAAAATGKKAAVESVAPVANKRHEPIVFESSNGASNNKQRRVGGAGEKKIYMPPSGKFSQSIHRGRGGGGYRGGRGRGGYRGGYRK